MQRLDKTAHTNMTHGAISAHLVRFAIPLLAGNLLQLLYSFVDAWVVGNYVSDTAFSAIGTVVPVIDILINLFLGLASGASAVISQLFGAKNFRELNKTVHTAIALSSGWGRMLPVRTVHGSPPRNGHARGYPR